jgi:hypothetical protein
MICYARTDDLERSYDDIAVELKRRATAKKRRYIKLPTSRAREHPTCCPPLCRSKFSPRSARVMAFNTTGRLMWAWRTGCPLGCAFYWTRIHGKGFRSTDCFPSRETRVTIYLKSDDTRYLYKYFSEDCSNGTAPRVMHIACILAYICWFATKCKNPTSLYPPCV